MPLPAANWYRHVRFAPPCLLSHWVEHFWLETWRLSASDSETRELLPHPCVQLAFSPAGARIYGVQEGRFVRTYRGEGRVFGVKFRVGAFFPFFGKPVSLLTNTSMAGGSVFAGAGEAAAKIFDCSSTARMVDVAGRFLSAKLPPADANLRFIGRVVAIIMQDRAVTRVHHLVSRFSTPERLLQRLFQRYVGASPRWVIKRYRTYEALDHLNAPQPQQLAALAQDLGYFDQAHFANDFKTMIGQAPSEYTQHALRLRTSAPAGT